MGKHILVWIFLLAAWWTALFLSPLDAQQGSVYRIIYLHVPVAACALIVCGLGLFVHSLLGLRRPQSLISQRAWAEVALVFTVLTLMSGSIWGKPTWGTWWEWDARLTTTLLFAILLTAYIILYESLAPKSRQKVCSLAGLIICVDIPVIYKSVSWWRTLHQPATLIETRGATMAPEMLQILLLNLAAMIGLCLVLYWQRRKILERWEQLHD